MLRGQVNYEVEEEKTQAGEIDQTNQSLSSPNDVSAALGSITNIDQPVAIGLTWFIGLSPNISSLQDLIRRETLGAMVSNPLNYGLDESKLSYLLVKSKYNEISETKLIQQIEANRQLLLESINELDTHKNTPLHWSAILNYPKLTKYLRGFEKQRTSINRAGLTPSLTAAFFGHNEFILSEFNKRPEFTHGKFQYQNVHGVVVDFELNELHLAIISKNTQLINVIFETFYAKHIPIKPEVRGVGNILHLLVYSLNARTQSSIDNQSKQEAENEAIEVLQLLVKQPFSGKLINLLTQAENNWENCSPIELAAKCGQYGLLTKLIDYMHLDVTEAIGHGEIEKAFWSAALNKQSLVVDMLLDYYGFKPNLSNPSYRTLMQKAGPNNKEEEFAWILETINSNARDEIYSKYVKAEPKMQVYKNLVLQGGGGKGLVYPYALEGLQQQCEARASSAINEFQRKALSFSNIERVVGTSVGAIFAMGFAIGFSVDKMKQSLNLDFEEFLENDVLKETLRKKGVGEEIDVTSAIIKILDDFKIKISRLMQSYKQVNASNHPLLSSLWQAAAHGKELYLECTGLIEGLKKIDANFKGLSSGSKIKDFLEQIIQKENLFPTLTFGELAELVKLYPEKYKHLHVVVTNLSKNIFEVLSSENPIYANYIIVDAVRASTAIPLVFTPAQLRMKEGDNIKTLNDEYIDGGILRNYAIGEFDFKKYADKDSVGDPNFPILNKATIGFCLRSDEELKSSHNTKITSSEILTKILNLAKVYYEAEQLIINHLNLEYHRSIVLKTQKISTFTFKKLSESEKKILQQMSFVAVKDYFNGQQNVKEESIVYAEEPMEMIDNAKPLIANVAPIKNKLFQKPYENKDFIGRTEYWNSINTYFSAAGEQALVLTAHGMGGVGKSELAARYYFRATNPYSLRAWFNAKSKKQLYTQYIALAKDNDFALVEEESIEEKVKSIKKWLEEQSNCLLVYDDVENIEDIEGFLPESEQHHILITSRNQVDWRPYQRLEIKIMEEQEAIDLVVQITGINKENNLEKLKQLVNTLGRLPLALAQAGSYIDVRQTAIDDYLREYHRIKSTLLSEQIRPGPVHEPVWVTFRMNFDSLEKDCPGALKTLKQASWLDARFIPEDLLIKMIEPNDEVDSFIAWGKIKENVARFSLMQFDKEKRLVDIHPILQDILQDKQEDTEQLETFKKVCDACDVLFQDFEANANYHLLLSHAERLHQNGEKLTALAIKQKVKDAEFLLTKPQCLEELYVRLGLTSKSIEYLTEKKRICERCYGKEYFAKEYLLENLGHAYWESGKPEQAKEYLESALEIKKEHWGPNDFKIARSLEGLGLVYWKQWNLSQAEEYLKRALEIEEGHFGKGSIQTAKALLRLGNIYMDRDENSQSKNYYQQALDIQEAYYGKGHFETAKALLNLGSIYAILGNYDEAKNYYQQALDIQEHHYGKGHFETAKAILNLGSVYRKEGNFTQALKNYELALTLEEKHYGKNHFELIKILISIGGAYFSQRNFSAAKIFHEQALYITKENFSATHYKTGETLIDIGDCYYLNKEFIQAINYYEKGLIIREEYLEKNSIKVAKVLRNLGKSCLELGEAEKAKDYLERAKKAFESQGRIDDVAAIEHLLQKVNTNIKAFQGFASNSTNRLRNNPPAPSELLRFTSQPVAEPQQRQTEAPREKSKYCCNLRCNII